jgi:hypothetical protein
MIDEIDEVEELLGDVHMGTFYDANIGESSAAQGGPSRWRDLATIIQRSNTVDPRLGYWL